MARFDWYQATIPAPVNDVLEVLHDLADQVHMRHAKGKHGYAHETVLNDQDGPIGKVWHGGTHEYPHAVFSGEQAQPGAELIRLRFPDHTVSRADACEDFDQPVYDSIQSAMLTTAKAHRVKVGTAGDHLLTKEGRTLYLGSPKSVCRMRLYDKAAELRSRFARDPIRLSTVPQHLVRLEAQVRPATSDARRVFARMNPVEVMGCAAWLREVWRLVMGMELEPVEVRRPWRQADDERAYAYLLSQYGKVLQRMKDDLGSWDCVGLQLGHDLAERQTAEKRAKGLGPA